MAAGFLSAPTDITPVTTGSYVDVDLSAYLPVGATGAFFLVNTPTSPSPTVGWRKKGSTDTWTTGFSQGPKTATFTCGVDGSRICQINNSDTANKIYLVGWLTSADAVFFTNAVNKTPGTTGSFQNVDISADVGADTAIGALLNFSMTTGLATGARKNGSTDARTDALVGGSAIVGVDGAQICQVNIASGTVVYLQGYIIGNAVFNTNATDISLGSTGSYVDLAALPNGAVAGIYETISTGPGQSFYIRKNGNTDDYYVGPSSRHQWGVVPCDGSRIVEEKISNAAVDTFLVGYFAPPIPVSINLTGISSTGAAGTLVKTISKTPTGVAGTGATGTIAIQALKTLTGVAGAGAAGTITPKALISLLGVAGTAAMGALVADTAQRIHLAGVQGASAIGALQAAVHLLLTGNGAAGDVGALAEPITLALIGAAAEMGIGDVTIADNWIRAGHAGGVWAEAPETVDLWTPTAPGSTGWTRP